VKRHADVNPESIILLTSCLIRTAIFTFQAKIRVLWRDITARRQEGQPGLPMPFLRVLISIGTAPGTFVPPAKLASNGVLEVRKRFLHRLAICMSRIVRPIAYGSMRLGPVTFCEILFRAANQLDKPIHLLLSPDGRYLLLEAAVTIQFSDTILAETPRASLSRQNPVVLVAPREWHSATTVSFTLPVAIQRRSSVTIPKMADHPASHSSRISETTRNFLMLVG